MTDSVPSKDLLSEVSLTPEQETRVEAISAECYRKHIDADPYVMRIVVHLQDKVAELERDVEEAEADTRAANVRTDQMTVAWEEARRENIRWENAHKILLDKIERLKRPPHEREMPHCSTCSCPPYETPAAPSKERISHLISYWEAKAKSHERWPEGQGLHAEALGRVYCDTITALQQRYLALPPGDGQR